MVSGDEAGEFFTTVLVTIIVASMVMGAFAMWALGKL